MLTQTVKYYEQKRTIYWLVKGYCATIKDTFHDDNFKIFSYINVLILFLINSRQLTVGAMFNRTFMNYQSLVAVSVSIEFVFLRILLYEKNVSNNLLTCKIADIYNLFADTECTVRKWIIRKYKCILNAAFTGTGTQLQMKGQSNHFDVVQVWIMHVLYIYIYQCQNQTQK